MRNKIIVKYNFNTKIPLKQKLMFEKKIVKEFNVIGKTLKAKTKQSMRQLKSGVFNPVTKKPRSAKGEGLANETGETSRSIDFNLGGSKWLDFGGDTEQLNIWEGDSSGKFNNRPTLLKQVNKYGPILQKRFKNMFNKK